jgi:hypothetical protein
MLVKAWREKSNKEGCSCMRLSRSIKIIWTV